MRQILKKFLFYFLLLSGVFFLSAHNLWSQTNLSENPDIADNSDPFESIDPDDPYFVDGFLSPPNLERDNNKTDGVNTVDPDLLKIEIKKLEQIDRSPICPKSVAKTTVYYPAGTGNKQLDNFLAKEAKEAFERARAIFQENFNLEDKDGRTCQTSPYYKMQAREVFDIYQPRPGLISLVVTNNISSESSNHPSTTMSFIAFDVKAFRQLGLGDLFTDPQKSIPLFWAYIVSKWCSLNQDLPDFYGGDPCEPGFIPPLPPDLAKAKTLEALGNAVITKEGLFLILDPYESWGYASGFGILSIPKDDLLTMGASPLLWTNK
jgi:hypothetical protein